MSVAERIAVELAQPAPRAVQDFAGILADPARDASVLYYGSTLRTGDLSGVLDFYRLTRSPHRGGLRGVVERVLWPEVSYVEANGLRAKVSTMPVAAFRKAAQGRYLDTTIWARFVQPAQLVWSADAAAKAEVEAAVAAAVITGARFAAALGPECGRPADFWTALFRRTYAAEYRFETIDRADHIMGMGGPRYDDLLPLAWTEGGVAYEAEGDEFAVRRRPQVGWGLRSAWSKPLNVARIAKGAFTFEGAARYAAYKIAKHTGVEIEVTPFAERYPLLAAPGAWWKVRRARKR